MRTGLTGSASGKTSFFRRHFEGTYEHVNQDTLKRREVCWSVAEAFIKQGRSVVVGKWNLTVISIPNRDGYRRLFPDGIADG